MKILVDMNLSPRWTSLFSEAGIEAVHWSDLGAPNASDHDIMSYAREHNYVVLTHDLDFSAILAATNGEKPSVVQVRTQDVRPAVIGDLVVQALRLMEGELDAGALVTIDPKRLRSRLLPLRAG